MDNGERDNRELQDMKDYLEIVLSELDEVKKKLNDQPVRNPYTESMEQKKNKKRRRTSFKKLAILEGAILLIIGISFAVHLTLDARSNVPTSGGSIFQEGNSGGELSPAVKTVKQVKELAKLITPELQNEIAPFKVTTERLFGLEYLVFTDGTVKICYRNEFLEEEIEDRLRILIDNGTKMMELNWNYDLTSGLEGLCPKYGSFLSEGMKQFAFLNYAGKDSSIPKEVRIMDVDTLWEYPVFSMEQAIKDLFVLNYEELHSVTNQDGDMRMTMKLGSASYTYAITKEAYIDAVYYDEFLLKFDKNFDLKIGEEGFVFETVVSLSEKEYLGELSAKLILKDGVISLGKTTYSAYVTADQEDSEKGGLIIPSTDILEDRIALWGHENKRYLVPLSNNIPRLSYQPENFIPSNGKLEYMEQGVKKSIHGIDVSKYQGDIDWKKVKESGVEFAILRLGFRGFNEGTLEIDPYFVKNVEGATKAGVSVGVYFFSQAVTLEEANEEAEFILELIKDYKISYPVIFDTEYVTTYDARANKLARQLRTDITKTFCEKIQTAGYHPMIYANTKWMVMGIDLEQLSEYDLWFAYYGNNLTFPYDFQMYQYSDSGTIPGIKGNVDLNISFIDYANPALSD
ncbi:glycoside hydrolase family 25 protein [Lachnoclostridium phytofermentans]|uniref:Glycoside hydrolase family 25 n=1 Tax=Lachnoclostridium phytofermentans (strain ATCC 700394 / DSM 18823 / ISDg) TaxID=357809 RepID=A9KQY6_LACP7|nr:glycoside hydrolase family 25 protein [Lachnoclostridium phytofermentans]ABX43465.1 glycoside hydrolase family 25 [Lachnoclostridium phytofermentans ISDg]